MTIPGQAGGALGFGDDVEVVAVLGRGAATTVYEIRRHGVRYALKVRHDLDVHDEHSLVAFTREAALLTRVNHPGVPRVFDVGRVGGRPYLVMEYIAGRPLAEHLVAGPLNEARLYRIGSEVAAALAATHQAGLVHRDVKPSNIIVTPDGAARLIDFGLATAGRALADSEQAGTFDYCSPEQTGMLARPVDCRSDLYSLGVVLFECATGDLPFRSSDVGELLREHATTPAPDLRSSRPEVPTRVAEVVARLLAKDPDDRYPDAMSLFADLSDLASDGTRPPAPGSGSAAADVPTRLAGRKRELDELLGRWERARDGRGGVVLIQGPVGVGKTRLTEALRAGIAATGGTVLSATCPDHGQVPAAVIRAAIDEYARSVALLAEPDRSVRARQLLAAAAGGARLLAAVSPSLSGLLAVPPLDVGADDRHEQFAAAIAVFLAGLARGDGGLVVILDDVQWLNSTALSIVRRIAEESADAPLLVVAAAGIEASCTTGLSAFLNAVGDRIDHTITLDGLGDEAVGRLVTSYLAGCEVGEDLIAEVAARGAGNPLTIIEYLRALIDAGALRPCWGTWRLDSQRGQAVDLPSDVTALIVARVEGLAGHARELLRVAAVVGQRFDPQLVAAVHGADPTAELAEAISRGLVRAYDDGYVFLHNRIREALLSTLSKDELRDLHQRIATVLDQRAAEDANHTYAVAYHYARGDAARTPERVFATNWAAGRLALVEHAPDTALGFLEVAVAAAQIAGCRLQGEFREAIGRAYLATGQLPEAETQLVAGLDAERDPIRRARLCYRLALVQRAAGGSRQSIDTVRRGLAELGRPVPREGWAAVLWTIPTLVGWFLTGGRLTGPKAQPADLERRLWYTRLCTTGITASILAMRPVSQLAFTMRAAHVMRRLPPSHEQAECLVQLALFASGLRLRRRAADSLRRSLETATALKDPVLDAHLAWVSRLIDLVQGRGDGTAIYRVAVEQRRWLDLDFYLNAVGSHTVDRAIRGYAKEAMTVYAQGQASLPDRSGMAEFDAWLTIVARTLLGATLSHDMSYQALEDREPGAQLFMLIGMLHAAVEREEFEESFDQAALLLVDLKRKLGGMPPDFLVGFAYLALGRIALARRAQPAEAGQRLKDAAAAVRQLGRVARSPLLRAYHLLARADLAMVRGRPDAALRLLGQLAPLLGEADAPVIEFEAARVAARALLTSGQSAVADRQVRLALTLADEYGWVYRSRAIRAEFGLVAALAGPTDRPTASRPGNRDRRRLLALQQVSLAAATVLDPQRLSRVALDETIRILGAERAILFLADPGGQLLPTLGRDTSQRDLDSLTAYSASLVDRVAVTRQALVVTGSEEGIALGSHSAVVYGLRSIMIAPLELADRLLGIVYLDSRVAKGVFTRDDVDILTAVTNHIAVSLETARVAKLEVAVQAAQQQRDVAETLRQAMADLAGTLDPEQVLRILLNLVGRVVPADRVCLLATVDGVNVIIRPGGARPAETVPMMLAVPGPLRDDPAADHEVRVLLGPVRSWLAVPLASRVTAVTGVLLAGATGETFGDEHVKLVAAIVGQATTAYDHADLYRQVQRLAATDPLTGISNRRHFTEHATRQLGIARRNCRPLIALMIDIDHFKKINDSHGHAAGDEVIRVIAGVLRANIRDHDVLGRYGGEEFALVATEVHGDPGEVAERIRAAVAATAHHHPSGTIRATVSIGFAELKPDDTLDDLLDRADQALYRAKSAGRDCVRG